MPNHAGLPCGKLRGVRRLAVAALLLGLLGAASRAGAAPTLKVDGPAVQRPDRGFGTVFTAECVAACDLRFAPRLFRNGRPLRKVGRFPPTVFRNVMPGTGPFFFYRWTAAELRRLARA